MGVADGHVFADERGGPEVARGPAAHPVGGQPDLVRVLGRAEHVVIAGHHCGAVRARARPRVHDGFGVAQVLHRGGGSVLLDDGIGGHAALLDEVRAHGLGFRHLLVGALAARRDDDGAAVVGLP